eukprot:2323920-Prymnesium_polylepis.1
MRLAFLTPRLSCCPRYIHADVSGSVSRTHAASIWPQAPSALLRFACGGSAAGPCVSAPSAPVYAPHTVLPLPLDFRGTPRTCQLLLA